MNCVRCEKKLSAYIDNEVSPRDRQSIEKHLLECSTCRMKHESLKNISTRLKELPRIEGDLAERNRLVASLHEKIAHEPMPKPVSFHFPTRKIAYAGVFIIVLLVLTTVIVKNLNQSQPPFGYQTTPDENYVAFGPMDEIIIDRMVQVMEYERINASQYETFSEPVLGVYVYEPAPPIEGGNPPDTGDYPIRSS